MNTDNVNQVAKSILRLLSIFTRHLNEQNLTYSEHFVRALKLSLRSGLASLIFFIHALFPFLFETYGSKNISSLYHDLNKNTDNSNTVLKEKNF